MENKFGSVRNPLTVIAIFAGIAEISGTAVLPHIAAENQYLYIWFLMLFPFALIFIFFLTLNFNHRVLYAPSDFKDEDNFINILKKSSFSEIIEFKAQEKIQLEEEIEQESIATADEIKYSLSDVQLNRLDATTPENPTQTEEITKNYEEILLSTNVFSTKDQRNKIENISRQISERRFHELRLAERLALKKIESEMGVNIERDMKMEVGSNRSHFDGIVRQGSKLTAIEVKYFRSRRSAPMNMSMWSSLRRNLENLYESLNEEQRKDFSFVVVVVNDNDPQDVEASISKRLVGLPFPTAIKMYDFDSLMAEHLNLV